MSKEIIAESIGELTHRIKLLYGEDTKFSYKRKSVFTNALLGLFSTRYRKTIYVGYIDEKSASASVKKKAPSPRRNQGRINYTVDNDLTKDIFSASNPPATNNQINYRSMNNRPIPQDFIIKEKPNTLSVEERLTKLIKHKSEEFNTGAIFNRDSEKIEVLDKNVNNINQKIDSLSNNQEKILFEIKNIQEKEISLPEDLKRVYDQLIDMDFTKQLAQRIIIDLQKSRIQYPDKNDSEILRNVLLEKIEKYHLPEFEKNTKKPLICFLIGNTGVGKTTTLSKLASNYIFQENKEVGFITMDTYRVAAVDQLKVYTKIFNEDLKVANNILEFNKAILEYIDKDIILIDTSGHSHLSSQTKKIISRLKELKNSTPYDVHNILLISSNLKRKDMQKIYDTYNNFISIDNIIFTKLDETDALGTVYDFIESNRINISHFTVGQEVPGDIRPYSAEYLVDELLKKIFQSQRNLKNLIAN